MSVHFKDIGMIFSDTGLQQAMMPRMPLQDVVMGPLGEPLTLDSLPPRDCTRWVPRRKAEVVAAVNGGLLTIGEACARYDLTLEEFLGWLRAVDRSGLPGLRVTQATRYQERHGQN